MQLTWLGHRWKFSQNNSARAAPNRGDTHTTRHAYRSSAGSWVVDQITPQLINHAIKPVCDDDHQLSNLDRKSHNNVWLRLPPENIIVVFVSSSSSSSPSAAIFLSPFSTRKQRALTTNWHTTKPNQHVEARGKKALPSFWLWRLRIFMHVDFCNSVLARRLDRDVCIPQLA